MAEPRTEIIDNVNSPKHYTECSLECIEVMELTFGVVETFNFCVLNAFKYLWRYKNKNGAEDIKKAKWYLNYAEHLYESHITAVHTMRVDKLETLKELWVDIADKEGVYGE